MAPNVPVPQIVFSTHVDPVIKPSTKPKPISIGPLPQPVFEDDGRYNLPETPPGQRRPPLSRRSTEILRDISERSRNLPNNLTEESQDQKEKTVIRSRTAAVAGPSSANWAADSEPLKRPTRSNTDKPARIGRPRQEPDLSALITSKIKEMGPIGLDEAKQYISETELRNLITVEHIQKALDNPSQKIVDFAEENPKVFALTVLVHKAKSDRKEAMESFEYYDFTDRCLPVKNMAPREVCPVQFRGEESVDEELIDDCQHCTEARAFHGDPWTVTEFDAFFETQWRFLVPKILQEKFEYEFGTHIILPFQNGAQHRNDDDEGSDCGEGQSPGGVGHFGEVRLGMMLSDRQNAIPTVSSRSRFLALITDSSKG